MEIVLLDKEDVITTSVKDTEIGGNESTDEFW